MEISQCRHSYCISQQREIEISRCIKAQLTGILAHQPCLGSNVIVQSTASGLAQLSSYAQCVFVVNTVSCLFIWQHEVPHVRCYECFQPGFCPLVESFKQCHGKRVLQFVMPCLVINGITSQSSQIIVCVCIEIIRCFVSLIDALVVVEMQCMDETRHRHILVL